MDDVVSRQTVKRQMIEYGFHAPDMTVTEFVEDLSSVNSQKSKTEPRYCDRNICLRNEYNSIGCNECEVTKSQESNTVIGTGDGAYYRIKALQAQADGDLTTALCSLPKIQSSDGQEYVQLYDVLETVRRYKPSVAIPPNHDGCKDCRWQSQSETEMPCKQCMHNYTDEWERAKTGHWILQPSNKEQGERDFVWWKCSECGQVIYSETEKDRREYHAFCGRCGKRMEK